MQPVTLRGHFDGERVCLDETFQLERGARLLITVVPDDTLEAERQAWLAASQASFSRAYAEDEPDYSEALLREKPPRE